MTAPGTSLNDLEPEVARGTPSGARSIVGGTGGFSDAGRNASSPHQGRADRLARKLLKVSEPGNGPDVHNIFSSSIALSATRCLLSYVVFPVLLALPVLAPRLGALRHVIEPAIGVPVGLLALVFDVRAIRRFFIADHRWRWVAAALYATVMAMVTYLVAGDIAHLF
jgi:hypothetical protein